jgi:aminoglycoside phosphotransferase (APT) family kinase protein
MVRRRVTGSANEGRGYDSPIMGLNRDMDQLRTALTGWLCTRLGAPDLRIGPIDSPRTSGVANETILVDTEWTTVGDTIRQRFVVRVATSRPLFTDRPIHTQYLMYEALGDEPEVPVPRLVGYESDPEIIGAPFFVAERVDGSVPGDRPHFTESGFVLDASPAERRRLWESAVDALSQLHRVPTSRFDFLLPADPDHSGLQAELAYWRGYADQLDVGPSWNAEILDHGWNWLNANQPSLQPTALSWGDARIGNMIFRDFEVVALLDWDTVSLAGPAADLAWWIQMDRHAWELLTGLGTPDELVDRWQANTGREVDDLQWHLVFTAFRLGVIRMKLRRMMASDGLLPPSAALPGAHNESIELLGLWLDVTPQGERVVRKPSVRGL